jgi:hypothetical protein
MKETRYEDFKEMIQTSVAKAVTEGPFDRGFDVEITIHDEDGNEYLIQDVRFDPGTGTVVIEFDHDND